MAIFSPTEITDNYMRASVGKAASPAWRLFLLAVAAAAVMLLSRRCATVPTLLLSVLLLLLPAGTAYAWM